MLSRNSPENQKTVAVVTVPLPAQGHLNPLLHLSAHLAARHIPVHYIASATHIRQARQRLQGWNLAATTASGHLHFHDLPFPPLPSPPPPRNPAGNKFPSHLQPSFAAAAAHLLPHLSSLIRSLAASHRRVILLHDSSMVFATSVASPETESFAFHPSSAISNLFFLGEPGLCRAKLSSCFSEEFFEWVLRQQGNSMAAKGRLFNTCRSIEGEFLDKLLNEPAFEGQRIFAIGPLNPVVAGDRRGSGEECLKWLDRQPVASVVYVSFGTTAVMSREQVREIAGGIEASGQRFIWVRRNADGCDIFGAGEEEEEDLELVEWEER